MKKIIILLCSILFCSQAAAVENCEGKVTRILDFGEQCTSLDPTSGVQVPRLAYKLYSTDNQSNPNVSINQWLCSNTEQSDALVMGAYFSGREIGVRISGGTCTNFGVAYKSPQYLYLNP